MFVYPFVFVYLVGSLINRLSRQVTLKGTPISPSDFPHLNWALAEKGSDNSKIELITRETQLGFYDLQIPCATTSARHDRKLSLILDLDQTLVHAMKLSELFADMLSPVRVLTEPEQFMLSQFIGTDNPKLIEGFTSRIQFSANSLVAPADGEPRQLLVTRLDNEMYLIKLRPGLRQFLKELAVLYELHIYTKANRNYLNFLINELDPLGKLFTSAVARDDSPDLDTDLKILNRVCCRDMKEVIVFDDRVDVWNETPNNVVRAEPYNFLAIHRFAVIKALSDLVIASKDPLATATAVAVDYDCHLLHMKDVLVRIFDEYVKSGKSPAPEIVSRVRKQVLAGYSLQFSGFTDLQGLIKEAEDFGAICKTGIAGVSADDDESTTSVMVAAKHTKRVYDTKKEYPSAKIVHWSWLEHAKATWKAPSVSVFDHGRFRMDDAGVYLAIDHWEVVWIAANADDGSERGTAISSKGHKRRKRETDRR